MKSILRSAIVFTVLLLLGLPAFAFNDTNPAEIQKAAEAGNPEAQTQVGVLYSQGLGGLPMDKKKAVMWYRKAADQGFPMAIWNLAFMYAKGEGVEQNDKTAFKLFEKAAVKGYADAQFDLGYMYYEGIGVKQDREEGLRWINEAASQGNRDAKKFLKLMEEQSKPQTKP